MFEHRLLVHTDRNLIEPQLEYEMYITEFTSLTWEYTGPAAIY